VTIRGPRVALHPATPADRRTVWSWAAQGDFASLLYLEGPVPDYATFADDLRDHYFDGSAPLLGRCFLIRAEGREVGQITYNDIDDRGRTELDIWLAGEAECGRGVGSAALETLCDWLNRELGITEFLTQPSARNPRAVACYRKVGFCPLGWPLARCVREWGPADASDSIYMVLQHPGRLRRNRDGDAPFLRQMLYEAATWAPGSQRPSMEEAPAHPDLAKLLRGFGERAGDVGLVADDGDGRPLGAAWFRLWSSNAHSYGFVDEATPELAIAVVPERRGAGVGGLLLRGLVQEAGREGFARLSLSVAHGNRARRLYEKTGFREVGDDGGAATLLLELPS
jgi:RimJ/RimL family protein N-acetyltransferase